MDDELLTTGRDLWDKEAEKFDDEPDHGLRAPATRNAWMGLLTKWLPVQARVLDIGCGTGSLSVAMASLGHAVTGIDFSPAMIALARTKAEASDLHVTFMVMDAAYPLIDERFNVLLCRHVLWALPEPAQVLQRWMKLLKPNGWLVLIEGFWHTGGGLHADDVLKLLPAAFNQIQVQHLSDQPVLWGKPVDDERYAVIAKMNLRDS